MEQRNKNEAHQQGSRLSFGAFVDKAFYGMLIGIFLFGINSIRSLNASISKLNENMAVVIDKLSGQEKRADGFEIRLLNVESQIMEQRRASSRTR